MKFNKEDRTLEMTKDIFFSFYNDWRQLFGEYNWYNFTFLEVSAEKDDVCPGWEFVFVVLGLGIRLRINQDMNSTEQGRLLKERLDDVMSGKAKTISHEELKSQLNIKDDEETTHSS